MTTAERLELDVECLARGKDIALKVYHTERLPYAIRHAGLVAWHRQSKKWQERQEELVVAAFNQARRA